MYQCLNLINGQPILETVSLKNDLEQKYFPLLLRDL